MRQPYKRREYEAAKAKLAPGDRCQGGEITTTAGATESINLAFGAGRGHVVTTIIEHQSVPLRLNYTSIRLWV